MRTRISARSHARLRIRLRPARSRLRLRPHQKIADEGRHRVAPENDVALSRAFARCHRTDRRQTSRFHAAHQGRPPRESARHPRTYGKNDAVNYPTLSFKDRVVSVALSRAKELGFETVACASTGNLANSVAAQA